LRLLAGLDTLGGPTDSGRIWLDRNEITQAPVERRQIGFVFQDPALFESMSVLENAAFGLRMRGAGKSERRSAVLPWLAKVGLDARADDGVEWLSGGERQRLALVRALCWKPRLVLLDEPFSALDRELRQALRADLLALHREWPVPWVLVSHDREDVESLATSERKIIGRDAGRRLLV
jgi:putative spermidine/putrescine transport system ATP-binding protein